MSYIIEGRKFESYAEIADFYNIPFTTFKTRVQRWGDIEKAALTPLTKAPAQKVSCTVNGIQFSSIGKACDFFGANRMSVYRYMNVKKCSIEEAIAMSINSLIVVDNIRFKNIEEVCNHFKISKYAIQKHMSQGKTIHQAIKLVLEKRVNEFMFNGKAYQSINQICKDYSIEKRDIGMETIKGLSLTEALNKLTRK